MYPSPPMYPIKSIDPATQSIDRSNNLRDQRRYNDRLARKVDSYLESGRRYTNTRRYRYTHHCSPLCCCVPLCFTCVSLAIASCCHPYLVFIYTGQVLTRVFAIRSFVMQQKLPFFLLFFLFSIYSVRTCLLTGCCRCRTMNGFVSFPERLDVCPHLLFYLTAYTNTIRSIYLRVDYVFYFLTLPGSMETL